MDAGRAVFDGRIPAPVAMMPEGRALGLTAAICTRNRPESLRRALESLKAQEKGIHEVLVVENNTVASPEIGEVLEAFPRVRHELEPLEGLDFARNRALHAATQEIVAFLDDDVQVAPGWGQAFLLVFRGFPGVGLCTGRVLPLVVETDGQRLFEANGGYDRGTKRIVLPHGPGARLGSVPAPEIAWAVSMGNGSSLAVRRRLALELGGFDEGLDLGRFLPAGGDHDMLWRVLRAGYHVQYEPEAVAYHEHRRSLDEAYRQIVGQQRGLVAMLTKAAVQARGVDRLTVSMFLGWRLVKPGVRMVKRAAGRDPLPFSVLMKMWWQCLRGPASYLSGQREADRRRDLYSDSQG